MNNTHRTWPEPAPNLDDMAFGVPRDMQDAKFWESAFVQGGGVGIFADIIYTGVKGNSRGGQANWTGMAGPVFGVFADGMDIANDLRREALGEDTKAGAKIVRFVKGNAPLINLWYLRAIIDHLVTHDLQESISPGYLRSMQESAQRDFQQSYWWRPGGSPIPGLNQTGEDFAPERAPDLQAAAGQ